MINKKKYPNEWCLGCQKLEDYNFTGVNSCEYADIGKKKHLPDVGKTITEYNQLKI